MTSGRARQALKGRYAVNGENHKARVIDIFEIVREGVTATVALLRFDDEHDLVLRTLPELFSDFSVFSDERDADRFIAGHRPATSEIAAEVDPQAAARQSAGDDAGKVKEERRPSGSAGVARRKSRKTH